MLEKGFAKMSIQEDFVQYSWEAGGLHMIMMIGMVVYEVFKGEVVSVGVLIKGVKSLQITLMTQYTHDLTK